MESTPTLSKRQTQRSLSSKKKGKKEKIKNVIATPYSYYWPLVNKEDDLLIKTALNKHLHLLKQVSTKIPWKIIKDIPSDKRKVFRLNYAQQQGKNTRIGDKNGIVIGVNNVTKHLEKSELNSVLIENEVNPHLMVRHLVDMSVLNGIPVLIISNLQELLESKTGIKSVAVAFKKNLQQNSDYFLLNEKIKSIYEHYGVPEDQINYCRKQLFSPENNIEDVENESIKMEVEETINIQQKKLFKEPYLYRSSKKERVFVPKKENPYEATKSATTTDKFDFIPLKIDKTDEEEMQTNENQKEIKMNVTKSKSKIQNKDQFHLKSLVVHQIRSDCQRTQKKLLKIKKKKK